MRYILLLVVTCAIAGCGGRTFGYPYTYYRHNLRYEQVVENGWKIIPPPWPGWFLSGWTKESLPEYFPKATLNKVVNYHHRDYFYATYIFDNGIELATWIKFVGNFRIDKIKNVAYIGWNEETFVDNEDECSTYKTRFVILGFNPVDVDFDNTSVYYIKANGEKAQGTEEHNLPYIKQTYPPATYNLASPATIRERQAYLKGSGFLDHATFKFRFPMSCADLENAVFVVDGLYRHGKRLPPLRVRINYVDFSQVPK